MSGLPDTDATILPTENSPGRRVDGATLRVISWIARGILERDANSKRIERAIKVVARYPLYTLPGGDRHHILNEDMFEQQKRETAGRVAEAIQRGDEQAANEHRVKMMGLLSGAAE